MADGKVGQRVFEGRDPARKSYGDGWSTVRAPSGGTQVVRSATLPPPAAKKDEGGGGGGGGSSSGGGGGSRSPFTGDLNLPSEADIYKQYEQQIARGQALLEALGHESFREMISTALANKFTPPTEFQNMMAGQGTQPVTSQAPWDPSGLQNAASNALQAPLPTPGGGQGGGQNV